MAGGFFIIDRDNTTFQAVLREAILKPSTQFAGGDGLIFTNGRLERASVATATLDAILNAMVLPASLARPATAFLTTTLGERGQHIPCRGNKLKFMTRLTGLDAPPINAQAADATSTAAAPVVAIALGGDGANDFQNGTLFCNGEQRTISASAFGAGKHTFTLNQSLSAAPAAGDLVTVVPFSHGVKGVKLAAASPWQGIDTSVGGKTGGKVDIERVSLRNSAGLVPFVVVSFQA